MKRLQRTAGTLAATLFAAHALAAPGAKAAEPSPAQLHVRVAAQEKVIEALKARLDKLESGKGKSGGALRKPAPRKVTAQVVHPVSKVGLKPLVFARSTTLPAAPMLVELKSKLRTLKEVKLPKLGADPVILNQDPGSAAIDDLQFAVKALAKTVKQLAKNQDLIAATIASDEANTNLLAANLVLVTDAHQRSIQLLDANVGSLSTASTALQGGLQTLHDSVAADHVTLYKNADDIMFLETDALNNIYDLHEVILALDCNGYDWLPGRMIGRPRQSNYYCD